MRRFLGTSLALVALVAGLVAPNSASAVVRVEAFYGTFRFNEYGNGGTGGSVELYVAGRGTAVGGLQANIPSSTCPLSLSGSGNLSGALSGFFTFSVFGNVLVMTVGRLTGGGTFVVTRPVGNPCHQTNVEALVVGTVVG